MSVAVVEMRQKMLIRSRKLINALNIILFSRDHKVKRSQSSKDHRWKMFAANKEHCTAEPAMWR